MNELIEYLKLNPPVLVSHDYERGWIIELYNEGEFEIVDLSDQYNKEPDFKKAEELAIEFDTCVIY